MCSLVLLGIVHVGLRGMAPLTAQQLQRRHAQELIQAPLVDLATPYLLHQYLTQTRRTRLNVTDSVCMVWFSNCRTPAGGLRVGSAEDLEREYGDAGRSEAAEHRTA